MKTGLDRIVRTKRTELIKNRDGVIFIELVLVLSIVTVIFLATVTFSFLFTDYYGAQKVAREGAREACISKDIALARQRAEDAAWLWGLDQDRLLIQFMQDSKGVTCTVHYVARPFSRTFPELLNDKPLKDYHFQSVAIYPWTKKD
ncbi:MAG: hypothetical protein JL50_21585 [Peptococcaceae bacterium BICA1-7]|nr:MAG: hypothetical protein JL50_21585 [Peptococcaceae bacterium BICA1-7]